MAHKIVHQLWSFINTVGDKLVQSKSMALTIKQQASQSHTKNVVIEAQFTSSSDTQGQLVGATGQRDFRAKVYNIERNSPWALCLTEPVPEAFELLPPDWPQKYFCGQSARSTRRATLMSSYTKLFSS